ncbi:MAG: bifunctional riboflavin kinase/FAD synthetase [Archangiaceae bacterium]|nr:bifunctional riboflavin kinase/FAD synthetase [Archangiaceae bacterium]
MKVFSSLDAAAASKELEGAAVCLGNFDGVHLGHRALIDEAKRHGVAAALTFAPHPGKVLQPELAPRLITLLPRKLELLEQAGLSFAIVQPFTLEYARTTAPAFEATLLEALKVKAVVVGYDFTYGSKRSGSVQTLQAACTRASAQLWVVPAVTVDGVVVSSSKVREYVLEGRVAAAQRLLGRYFDLEGTVVPGAGRGRTIGFPTANIDTQNELRPGAGVYAVRVTVKGESAGPMRHGGAANIGVKPTFGDSKVTIEAHLFDFQGDLYGKKLTVEFIDRLRGEQRFASVSELSGQIARDIESARTALARAR